ncbi:hypothetical protein NM688_g920 [Phlebia brevispora]|uniref:Uncharacterized protein n=1 Tax=Phlebia brevispora TaxID=194682 RepID=A0ACC1TD94_9APHY|nr:hypothetical protein NM688_g920 [Phlebia brevispora]
MPQARTGGDRTESTIKPIDALSAHRITSGQVVIDLQTAVKELVENSLDAGATSIEVRFKNYGLDSIEVIDNGTGISSVDYDAVALKHHTSKLSSFDDLTSVATFGFRGEALSSLCALADSLTVVTATDSEAPMGTVLEFDKQGKLRDKNGRVARQRGTTVTVSGLFKSLPVRRKELERNAKREFGKALHLLNVYALVPCAQENGGVKLICSNQPAGGKKTEQLHTDGSLSIRASISALWGPKTLNHLDDLDLKFEVETEHSVLRRLKNMGSVNDSGSSNEVQVRGIISRFAINCGRSSADRQFFYINGRPCQPSKVQRAFNEVYRTFNATQSPLVIADFILPKDSLDINVSPDKRTIFIHSEDNLVQALKAALEERFAPERSTYNVRPGASQTPIKVHGPQSSQRANLQLTTKASVDESSAESAFAKAKDKDKPVPLFLEDSDDEQEGRMVIPKTSSQGAPTEAASHDDPTMGFGRPVLLLDTLDQSVDAREAPITANSEAIDAAEVETASMDVELTSAVELPGHASQGEQPSGFTGVTGGVAEHTEQVDTEETRTASQFTPSAVAPAPSPARSSSFEETIHQIPPPRFLARSRTSSSNTSAYAATHATKRTSSILQPSIRQASAPSKPSTSAKGGADQMVLSTSGAGWNLQRQDAESGSAERARKRLKSSDGGKRTFKSLLAGYALPGSQTSTTAAEVEEESEEEGGKEILADDINSDNMDEDMDELDESSIPSVHVVSPEALAPGTNAADAIDLTQQPSADVEMAVASTLEDEGSEDDADLPEIVKSDRRDTVTLEYDMAELEACWRRMRDQSAPGPDFSQQVLVQDPDLTRDAGLSNAEDTARADEALSRIIEKADFASMEVVGQFNLGFIVVRRRKEKGASSGQASGSIDDLFIVDQHAADEKYNFETLQRTTKIESQKLFRPLELSAADELVALGNLDVLQQNGFEVNVASESASEMPRVHRLSLVAQPVSKNTVFDLSDLEELIHLLQDQPNGQMVRCSKARSMFAMRACRMSVMVGTPLTSKQMTTVIRHMGTIHQPWNCPHGRPTMRHLSDISSSGWNNTRPRQIDWQSFLNDGNRENSS